MHSLAGRAHCGLSKLTDSKRHKGTECTLGRRKQSGYTFRHSGQIIMQIVKHGNAKLFFVRCIKYMDIQINLTDVGPWLWPGFVPFTELRTTLIQIVRIYEQNRIIAVFTPRFVICHSFSVIFVEVPVICYSFPRIKTNAKMTTKDKACSIDGVLFVIRFSLA